MKNNTKALEALKKLEKHLNESSKEELIDLVNSVPQEEYEMYAELERLVLENQGNFGKPEEE